jgi:hypothetical protein
MSEDDGEHPDEEMLGLVRGARLRLEPAPAHAVAAALDAFAWRRLTRSIADLQFDSALDDDRLARVRDDGSERRLRFVTGGRAVEIALVNRALAGTVDPPLTGPMVLHRPDGSAITAPVDRRGKFFFDFVEPGPISLRPLAADGAPAEFETEWVTI